MRKERQRVKEACLEKCGKTEKAFIGNETCLPIKKGHVAMMRATPPQSNQYGSRTPSTPIAKKKNPHIPVTIQNMDDLGIGGQLIVPIISSFIERYDDEDNSKIYPTSNDHQVKTNSSVLNH